MSQETDALIQTECEKFKTHYQWLEETMPESFLHESSPQDRMLIVRNLIEFERQEYYASIHLKDMAIILTLDHPDADLKILKNYNMSGIASYQSYVSLTPLPFLFVEANLHVAIIHFFSSKAESIEKSHPHHPRQELIQQIASHSPHLDEGQIGMALAGMSSQFILSLSLDQLVIAVSMYLRASSRDACQYEVRYNEDWEKIGAPSMQILLAWRNTPKHNFLYRLMRTIHRHHLFVEQISASYKNLYQTDSILVVALDLHGINGKPVWETANILDFLKDLITVKYFSSFDAIDYYLVQPGTISGNMGNLLRAMINFIHQALVHLDVNLYTLEHVEEGLCRHPELTLQLCEAFKYRFDISRCNEEQYSKIKEGFLLNISKLDTGNEELDTRRKNILRQGINFIHYTLKTNFYRPNYTSLSFRLDPKYLDEIPFDRTKKFPELPFAILFIKGMHFFGFHIRFRDLARGGVRTVFPEHTERMVFERNSVFTECYNLAFTQQMKNKDIPEGGAKAIIFLKPYERLEAEAAIYKKELVHSGLSTSEVDQFVEKFRQDQRLEHLYQAQRSFIQSLISIVNTDAEGVLRSKDIVDYWKRPEYIYLGPDENMHDSMIEWIAEYSLKAHYKPGSSFISGKPKVGINHKEYGVTSLGVNVYVDAILRFLSIDPTTTSFTVKMSGGPDGDVAGNEICNLLHYYPKTAKLVALTDVSGTIYDPEGLDLTSLVSLFKNGQSIRFYPPQLLHPRGFLVDRFTKRSQAPLVQQTLCWKNVDGQVMEEWLSSSDANTLLRFNVHQTPADLFIPAGGRPRTLNETNIHEFLDSQGKPTAKAVVEGANLYLTPAARRTLEHLGVLIVKDSSANKTGVICSSFEVLCGLALGQEKFLTNKDQLVREILERLHQCAHYEAILLLKTHEETKDPLTDISDRISKRINLFTDQLLTHLEKSNLSQSAQDLQIQCFLDYCLPTLKEVFQAELLKEIPVQHKRAIIASHIASQMVYKRGLSWFPSIVDILGVILKSGL